MCVLPHTRVEPHASFCHNAALITLALLQAASWSRRRDEYPLKAFFRCAERMLFALRLVTVDGRWKLAFSPDYCFFRFPAVYQWALSVQKHLAFSPNFLHTQKHTNSLYSSSCWEEEPAVTVAIKTPFGAITILFIALIFGSGI